MGHRVIAIGREFGSEGKAIGIKLAEKLGVKCYDKELITVAAEQSGLCEDVFEAHDERPMNSFFYSLALDAAHGLGAAVNSGYMDTPLNQKVFLAQFEAIQKLAAQEDCVIVGRCADYALEGHDNLISVFISADMEDKVNFVTTNYDISKDKAIDFIAKSDKKRANYYNYYSNKKWGSAATYDLCINRSKTGIDGAVEIILNFIKTVEAQA